MELQTLDSRPPLAAAIALAKADSDSHLPKWRDDLAAMAAEVTRKYFGALTEEAVHQGVEGSIHLLSIGLLRSTQGRLEPAAWLQTLRSLGVRGAAKLAVELIKACDALPNLPMVFAGRDPFRPSVLHYLLAQCAEKGPLHGYRYLLGETASNEDIKRSIDLAVWLFDKTIVGRISKRDLFTFFGSEEPASDEVIHHILSLSCGLKTIDPYKPEQYLEEDDDLMGPPLDFQKTYALPPRRVAEARARYDLLLERVPADLQPALLYRGESWFERFVVVAGKKPKVIKEKKVTAEKKPPAAKKTPAKKKAAPPATSPPAA